MPDWPAWGYEGTYGYFAGTGSGTIDVPTSARLRRVSVIAGTAAATTIVIGAGGAGGTITVPVGYVFDEMVEGAAIGSDVVLAGGASQAYYISWAT